MHGSADNETLLGKFFDSEEHRYWYPCKINFLHPIRLGWKDISICVNR